MSSFGLSLQLVKNPENVIRRICEEPKVDFVSEMVKYGRDNLPRWRFGDQSEAYLHDQPEPQNVDKWLNKIEDPQSWRLARDYLDMLGRETVDQMGYSYEELSELVIENRPHRIRL